MTVDDPIGTPKPKVPTWEWPVNTTVISGYHYTSSHHALDIGARSGSKLFAPTSGVVEYAGWNDEGYGNLIILKAANGDHVYMAHLSAINVKKGMKVTTGQVIGKTGSTGNSSGPHLHLEIRTPNYGGWINPYDIFGKNPKPGVEISPAPGPGTSGEPKPGGTGTKPPGGTPPPGGTGDTTGTDTKTGLLGDPLGIGAWWETVKSDWAANRAKYGLVVLGMAITLIGIYGLISGEGAKIIQSGLEEGKSAVGIL